MKRPIESDYVSLTAYTRALEEYCDRLAQPEPEIIGTYLEKDKEQKPVTIWYMRDNHTFKKLSADVSIALIEIEQEFNEGYTYGTLCSKREGFSNVHASGEKKRLEFFAECKKTLEEWLPSTTPPQYKEPEQEPVAWANPNDLQHFDMKVRTNGGPLHTVPLYTTPPQRKPLTTDQMYSAIRPLFKTDALAEAALSISFDEYRAIEAAHGIKEES